MSRGSSRRSADRPAARGSSRHAMEQPGPHVSPRSRSRSASRPGVRSARSGPKSVAGTTVEARIARLRAWPRDAAGGRLGATRRAALSGRQGASRRLPDAPHRAARLSCPVGRFESQEERYAELWGNIGMLRKPLKRLQGKCQHYGCTTLSAWAGQLSRPSIRGPSRVFSGCTAHGFGADRRGNALILLDCEGSTKRVCGRPR